VNMVMSDGVKLSYIVCQNGHDNAVLLSWERGASVDIVSSDETTSLNIACQNGYKIVLSLLLERGAP